MIKVRGNGLSIEDLLREGGLKARDNSLYYPADSVSKPAVNNGYVSTDIPTNSLVYYAPLWLFKGSKFKTADADKHTATVTGATWGITGRTFDGSDDQMSRTTSTLWVKDAQTPATYIIWFNSDLQGADFDSTRCALAQGRTIFRFDDSSQSGVAGTLGSFLGGAWVSSTIVPTKNTWYHAAIAHSGTSLLYYINGVLKSTTANNTEAVTDVQGITVGSGQDTQYFDGTIGEVLVYYRQLSLAEIIHHYNLSKWRYQ